MDLISRGVINLDSDEDIIPSISSKATGQARSANASTSVVHGGGSKQSAQPISTSAIKLPRSSVLAGKTFAFRGIWLTMSIEAAEDLCRANGGEVTPAITSRTSYVVVGAKGTGLSQSIAKFAAQGATPITEADFLGMVLSLAGAGAGANKENASLPAPTAQKRALEDPSASAGPGRGAKAARKSEPQPEEEDMTWLHWFLADRGSEVRLVGKTLIAYDCGGQVYKAQRGKSAVALLRNFNKFLTDCKGEYHSYL